jgi:protein TIF31
MPLVCRHQQPKSKDGQQLLDAGKVFLGQGRLDVAFELFNEALAIFHQVYGPLHPDTALCYG